MSLPFARTIREFAILESTSKTARELVSVGGFDLPLLVLARKQTAGRGRGDHAWWSGEGSLTFTVALDPKSHGLRPEQESRVALGVACLVARIVEAASGAKAGIRWPNDVECRGRKLAGILPERVETKEGPRLLIGVGINALNQFDDAPVEIRAIATSVTLESSGPFDVARDLLDPLLGDLGNTIARVAREDPALAEEWRDRDLLAGRAVRLLVDGRVIAGDGAGIGDDGGLRLRTEGLQATYYGGQVLRSPDPTATHSVDERADGRADAGVNQDPEDTSLF